MTDQNTAAEADADTVANRAAQVITRMGADIRTLAGERDRYRTAWRSARERAQAYGEGILRVVKDREQYQQWLKQAEERGVALERAMESTAADALRHRGCHRDLMAQCLRAERAEAEANELRRAAAVPVPPPADQTALPLSAVERQFLTFALDLASDEMASRGDEFTADDEGALERLRRMAAEEQPAKPWLTDSARIGKTLIWSWTDCGKGAFGEGYRAAQTEVRALLTGERPAVGEQPAARPRCPHCQMPHDLTPSVALACASIRASIRDREQPETQEAHR